MRHEQTDWNAKGYGGDAEVLRGNLDIPLNAAGIADGHAKAEDLCAKYPVVEVRCSPNYIRDKQTGQIVAQICGVPLNFTDQLDPYNPGSLSGKSVAAIEVILDMLIDMPLLPAPGGGDTYADFVNRFDAYFHSVYDPPPHGEGFGGDPSRAIVLIVHGMEMRALPYVVERKPVVAHRHQSFKPGEFVVVQ
jgi:broad specificity phosphatase PhoE